MTVVTRALRAAVLLALTLAWLEDPARAQAAELRRVEARVTSAAGLNIYLDIGREAGIRALDEVVIYPSGRLDVGGVVRAVAKSSCRVELNSVLAAVPIGTRAEVLVPEQRLADLERERAQRPVQTPARETPDHPEWTHPPTEWSEDDPLLAPAFGRLPEERERQIRGRISVDARQIWDDEQDRTYTRAGVNFDLSVDNPAGHGGRLHVNGDASLQATTLSDGPDDTDTFLRLNRLSYGWGGTRDEPHRVELGRFLQGEYPELGVLDGAEWNLRLPSGSRFGASVGAMPVPFPSFQTGDDIQVAAFYRFVTGEDEKLALGAAYQNTWHEGAQDRNLFLATVDWAPSPHTTVYASAWVDYYGSDAQIKSQGFELTELRMHARYRPSNEGGIGVHASRVRWPELLRTEFVPVLPGEIDDNAVSRVGLDGWKRLGEHLRLDARVDHWNDQDDSGLAGNVGARLRNLLYERGEVSLALFSSDGRFSEGLGLRLAANRVFDRGSGTLGYEYRPYEFEGSSQSFTQNALTATFDLTLGGRSTLSLYGDRRFGDTVDSYSLGVRYTTGF